MPYFRMAGCSAWACQSSLVNRHTRGQVFAAVFARSFFVDRKGIYLYYVIIKDEYL